MDDQTQTSQVITNSQAVTITKALYGAETSVIRNTEYSTPVAKERDMLDSQTAYQNAMNLLTAEQNDKPYTTDQTREKVRELAWEVARSSLHHGIQNIKNMKLRAQYFQNVTDTVNDLRGQINQASLTDLEDLARQAMRTRDIQMDLYRAQLSRTASGFKDWMQGKTLIDLQRIYTQKRFPGQTDFAALNEEEKMLVYGDIIEASGRSTAFTTLFSDSTRYLSKGGPFILLTIGITLWQITDDAHPVTTIIENGLNVVATIEGEAAGQAIGASIGAMVGGPIGILVGGVLGGIIGGFVGGWASDHLFDAMVGGFSGDATGPVNQPLFVTPFKYQFKLPDNFTLTQSLLSQMNKLNGA
ncbi:hypothetical protein [Brevibacillus dissolubilis]|uniref:hypothetical protein n=1 Tax=Brevibacillus dissolubilis TaxID=1844116 RepID=UPI001116089A|nr:hypothetical protein [Brevibacillus dissolubilis]